MPYELWPRSAEGGDFGFYLIQSLQNNEKEIRKTIPFTIAF